MMALKEKLQRKSSFSPTFKLCSSNGIISPAKVTLIGKGSYYIQAVNEEDEPKLVDRKPLSSDGTNKLYSPHKKGTVTAETVKAAQEILAVLQDSPVKNKNMETLKQSKVIVNKVDSNGCKAVSNTTDSKVANKKNMKSGDVSEKLNDKDVAGMLFDLESSEDENEIFKSNKKLPDKKNNCSKNSNVTDKRFCSPKSKLGNKINQVSGKKVKSNKHYISPNGKKIIFDEEDILISLSSDSDDSPDELVNDTAKGEWRVKKSPYGKSSEINTNYEDVKMCPSKKPHVESRARRSLASLLESSETNK